MAQAEWAGGWAEVYPLLKLCWNAERYLHFMAEDPDNYDRCKASDVPTRPEAETRQWSAVVTLSDTSPFRLS